MHRLWHFRLCPFSRSIRLALAELALQVELVEERPWEWRSAFLALNPSGELPVLELEGGPILCGAYAISEYLAETAARRRREEATFSLFPGTHELRAEVRRLVDWFHGKFNREVTRELLLEKVYPRFEPGADLKPDPLTLEAIRRNLRHHLTYVGFLANQRRWLAGEELSFADLAAAAHISCVDALGEILWDIYPGAYQWYRHLKSRAPLRPLLGGYPLLAGGPMSPISLDF
jgi:glutathione S-transferase